jgi:hypothetical protein
MLHWKRGRRSRELSYIYPTTLHSSSYSPTLHGLDSCLSKIRAVLEAFANIAKGDYSIVTSVCLAVNRYLCMYTCMYVCMCMYECVCMYASMCLCICMYVCMQVSMCVLSYSALNARISWNFILGILTKIYLPTELRLQSNENYEHFT